MSEEKCRVGVVAIIENGAGDFLMERRTVDAEESRTWSFVAGGKKAGEDILGAAKREVKEEVNAEFLPEEIVGIADHESQRSDDNYWTVVGIKGSIRGEPENAEPEKRDMIEWKNQVPESLHPTSEMILEVYRSESLHSGL